ncbi:MULTISPECIES: hypothetical protein [unclassified Dietzia]|uniref:hypothetical protein n=1 Tax=unclassified Dietzia TaxID=2617939 RepID=UPI0015F9FB26|nr:MULTISPECIES: hypothetical protein [unclassified Dietzia]MBB1022964.1 hypothetical protein [Dietzia sp. DQ12-76]MBB1026470.1 hypothetical protein [Dietzia sp. DQ11-38-2]
MGDGIQVDGAERVLDFLINRVEGATVRSDLPDGWSPADGVAVTVTSDATPFSDRVATREAVRVAVYAAYRPIARRAASQLDAALIQPGAIRGLLIRPGSGLIITRDDKLECFLAAFTINVNASRN